MQEFSSLTKALKMPPAGNFHTEDQSGETDLNSRVKSDMYTSISKRQASFNLMLLVDRRVKLHSM